MFVALRGLAGEDAGVSDPLPQSLALTLSPDALEAIAQRVAEIVLEQLGETKGFSSPWLSLAEAAHYLRVSERQLQRLLARGKVRSTTIGRRRLLHRDDLDEMATGEDVAPTTPSRRQEA